MPSPLLRRPTPAPSFHPLFKIFQSPPPGEVIPPLKRRGGGGSNYDTMNKRSITCDQMFVFKIFLFICSIFFLFNFFDKCCPKLLCSPWIPCCMLVKILTFHLIFGDKYNLKIWCVPN